MRTQEREVDELTRSMEQLRLQYEIQVQEIQQKGEIHQDEQVQQLRCELSQISRDHEQLIATHQNSLEENNEVIRPTNKALQKEKQIQKLQGSQEGKEGSVNVEQSLKLKWKEKPDAPLETFGESSAIQGKCFYCYSWDENKIMMFNTETGKWTILLQCQKKDFSIAVVKGLLTAIGGQQSNSPTKSLLSLTEPQKWTEQFQQSHTITVSQQLSVPAHH